MSIVDFMLNIHYNYGNITPDYYKNNTRYMDDWIVGTLCKKTWIA